jgi:hypothetical protein
MGSIRMGGGGGGSSETIHFVLPPKVTSSYDRHFAITMNWQYPGMDNSM